MSVPRQVLPGSTYLITRRCTQRQFWLTPSKLTNQIILYCIAVAAMLTGVKIHAICAMGNHLHAVVTDPEAKLPLFMHWMNMYIAKCINASYGRWEALWASGKPSAVRLEGDEDVLDKIAYCLANPVSAGLVAHGRKWPGVRTAPRELAGSRTTIARPGVFFRAEGPCPKTVELCIERPPVCSELTDEQVAERVSQMVAAREANVRRKMAKAGRRFLGVERILRQRAWDKPKTREPRRRLSPRIAARNKWLRIEALRRVKEFIVGHAEALRAWCAGQRDVIFPPGTYAMRVIHNARVAPVAAAAGP